ncbi:MAG: exodeoxyribonuclease VII large subunit [Zetaproteobacteria bacterium]|nr:MAG: exodeoxyribonuclease VII large subunit [Zetaproteobacteria bacterium]
MECEDSSAPLSVSELTAKIKVRLEQAFVRVRVHGEVSRLTRHRSGHVYFTIKDEHAVIAAVIWRSTVARLACQPVEGESFVFSGSIAVYEPRGIYQLIVRQVSPLGIGRLAAEFERRKQLFARRGWFDTARKRPTPPLPQHIGIVTSSSGAALQDVRKVLATRPAWLRLTLAPCLVQGPEAPTSIVHAITQLSKERPDLILLVRGGGSLEDLWCFNDERVVQAIVDCPVPIITGIGHEIDTTLADLAADKRAATPSNAAELACPSRDELRQRLVPEARWRQMVQHQISLHRLRTRSYRQKLQAILQRQYNDWRSRVRAWDERLYETTPIYLRQRRNFLHALERRLQLQAPAYQLKRRQRRVQSLLTSLQRALRDRLRKQHTRLTQLDKRLNEVARRPVLEKRRRLQSLLHRWHRLRLLDPRRYELRRQQQKLPGAAQRSLHAHQARFEIMRGKLYMLNPKRVLARGYTITCDEAGTIITHARAVPEGTLLHTQFQDGTISSRVVKECNKGEWS